MPEGAGAGTVLYTPSPNSGFAWLVHPPGFTGLRPHYKGSAGPSYTAHSQHCCAAEIYEACQGSLSLRVACLLAPAVWVGATFVRRCFRASVALHACAIAT